MAEAKKTVKKVEQKVKDTAKKVAKKVPVKKATVKKPVVKKVAAKKATKPVKTTMILQFAGKEIDPNALAKKAAQVAKKSLKKPAKEITIYIKPEEHMVYYVANGGEDIGSFAM